MEIWEISTCKKCNKKYYGRFYLDTNGDTYCVESCDFPTKLNKEIIFSVADSEKDISAKYFNFFYTDLENLYTIYSHSDEDIYSKFKINGMWDNRKIFYMGNDLSFCEKYRHLTYQAQEYINSPSEKIINYNDFALEFILNYFELREKKLTKKEKNKYIENMSSKNMEAIIKHNVFYRSAY